MLLREAETGYKDVIRAGEREFALRFEEAAGHQPGSAQKDDGKRELEGHKEAGDDAAFVAKALGTIARARGMTQLARSTGLGRESLYKALSGEGNPSFSTILKVAHALGLKLGAQSVHA